MHLSYDQAILSLEIYLKDKQAIKQKRGMLFIIILFVIAKDRKNPYVRPGNKKWYIYTKENLEAIKKEWSTLLYITMK